MTERSSHDDPWLKVAAVALALGISPSKVRVLIAEKKLRAVRHDAGGMWLVRQSWCASYLEALETDPAAEAVTA